MPQPPSPHADALARHGDALYQVALLLAPDPRRAEAALRSAFPTALQSGATLDDLLPPLLAALAPKREAARRRKVSLDITSVLAALPFAQRRTIVLRLLLGESLTEAARLGGIAQDAARDDYAAGLASIATLIGQPLPDAQPTEQCAAVRATIARGPADAAAEASVRGHAALCADCRAFERAWATLVGQVEAALRARVRDVRLPSALADALRQPRATRGQQLGALVALLGARRVALALVPVGVLVLIAALVLPGFWRGPASSLGLPAAPAPPVRVLVQRAEAHIGRPPAGEGALWHGRWQTQWYFPGGSVAPITLDAWLDPRGPRHRLQVTHAQGGAPFELQIGSGDELFYALSATYYESLYGAAPLTRDPKLVRYKLGADVLPTLARERMAAGVWGLPDAYLRQAQSAPDLRVLGRQREGERAVWVVAFTGFSPLDLPADAPRTTGDGRVRVLLALDANDAQIRSVTELSEAGGGAQTSTVTWRLASEEWLPNENDARAALDPQRAWNGRGAFPDTAQITTVDPTLLLADATRRGGLEGVLAQATPQTVTPSAPPDAERALVLWNSAERGGPFAFNATEEAQLVYFGPGRQLTLSWRHNLLGTDNHEEIFVSGWKVRLQSRRGGVYRVEADVQKPASQNGPPPQVSIEARGYTRAELTALIEGLGQIDLVRWRQQRALFADASGVNPQARAALEAVLDAAKPPPPDMVRYQRRRTFSRHVPPPDPLVDPFHLPPGAGEPEESVQESWMRQSETPGYWDFFSRAGATNDGKTIWSGANIGPKAWFYDGARRSLNYYTNSNPTPFFGLPVWVPLGAYAALDMLANPGDGPRMTLGPNDERIVERARPITASDRERFFVPGMFEPNAPTINDLNPQRVVTTLAIDRDAQVTRLLTTVVGRGAGGTPRIKNVQWWELEKQATILLADSPSELRVGAPPNAPLRYVVGERSGQAVAHTVPLSEALALATTPLVEPPLDTAEAELLMVEVGQRGPNNERSDMTDPFDDAVRNGVALRFTYWVPGPYTIKLIQGPAEPFADYIRTHYQSPFWERSEAGRFTIGDRPLDGWLLWSPHGAQDSYLLVEYDGTLVALAGPAGWLEQHGISFLAGLERAK